MLRMDGWMDRQTEGQSGPITRPAFAKERQVKSSQQHCPVDARYENVVSTLMPHSNVKGILQISTIK